MKNFSTGVVRSLAARAAIATAAAWLAAGPAQAATECTFRPNAPDKHVVVKHDTLWDISGTFLEHPWCWPQVWGMNRDEIRNPHWIYPGQIIYFDRSRGRLSLTPPGEGNGANGNGSGNGGEPGVTRLSPQLRTEDMVGNSAVPSIPQSVIAALVTQPLVIEPDQLESAPHIVAATDVSRIYLGRGDRIYVRGDLRGVTDFQVFHPGKPLVDPDTRKVIAYDAINVGTAHLVQAARPGVDVHTFEISGSTSELSVGDRLRPVAPPVASNFVPHAPEQRIQARVMSMARESPVAAQNQIVTINRGAIDGLDIGSVLIVYHPGQTVVDPRGSSGLLGIHKEKLKLPDENVGNLFIFRVFGHVSYGLVMESKLPIEVGDYANSPE